MVSQRILKVWLAVAVILVVTAGAGWWLSRPDPGRWAREGGADAAGEVAQRSGAAECEGLTLLDIQPAAALAVAGTFVRDAGGVLGEDDLARFFARPNGSLRRYGPDATLPEDAVQTPWTRGDAAVLWLEPANDDYAFLAGDRVEAWPRADGLPCAEPAEG